MNPSKDTFFSNLHKTDSPILPFGEWKDHPINLNHILSSESFKTCENKKSTNLFNFDASNKNNSESTYFSNLNSNQYDNKSCLSSAQTPEIITQFDFIGDDANSLSDNFIYESLMEKNLKKQRIDNINQDLGIGLGYGGKTGGLTGNNLEDLVKSASIFNNGYGSYPSYLSIGGFANYSNNFRKKKGIIVLLIYNSNLNN